METSDKIEAKKFTCKLFVQHPLPPTPGAPQSNQVLFLICTPILVVLVTSWYHSVLKFTRKHPLYLPNIMPIFFAILRYAGTARQVLPYSSWRNSKIFINIHICRCLPDIVRLNLYSRFDQSFPSCSRYAGVACQLLHYGWWGISYKIVVEDPLNWDISHRYQ